MHRCGIPQSAATNIVLYHSIICINVYVDVKQSIEYLIIEVPPEYRILSEKVWIPSADETFRSGRMSKKQVGRSLLCILSKTEQISTELTFTLQGRRFTGGSSCAGPSRSFRAAEILNRQSNCLPDNARFGKWLQVSFCQH